VLEAVWKVAPPAEADLWRGLAQLAVAVTHAARGNPTGARALAQRAAENLAAYESDPPHAVDVAALRDWCAAAAEDPTAATTPPQLRA
jgi:predicted metal-dependent hydrolase